LSKVGGEKILVVGHFLEVLPLAQLSHRVEAALAVEVMVEWFVFRDADAGRDVGFDVGKESPPPVGSFDSQGKIVQARARGSHGGEDPRGDGDEGVVVVLDGDLRGVAVVVFSQVDFEGWTAELDVGVPHPSGEAAIPEGPEGPGSLVASAFLATESRECPLVERGEVIQPIQEVFLEHLDQQGETDFSAGQSG
jgi:hypothetical protein